MTAALTDYKDGFVATGYAGSSTIGPVSILGGEYALMVVDTGTPDAGLEILGPDGSTFIQIGSRITTNGVSSYFLAAGRVRIVTGTGTSLSASLIRIPYRAA
ncbi:MAG TPA: hypothetical protein VGP42_13495 [Stellaceae bacterium]|jgi:hypothetical protein|nr:hypothetical protein [Stellaceae bacterium]